MAQQSTPETPDQLPPVRTSITVVDNIEAESPANLTVTDAAELTQTPGINLDERLGVVPGFTLYRRFSSTVSHPTAQGVSLRGIGPSGASRTLVRWDGVPINDPFGGWVQWTRLAPQEIGSVEIVRSPVTSAFGDRSMGGAISIFSKPIDRNRVQASYNIGTSNTHEATGGFGWLGDRFAASANVRGFTTNGYFVVPKEIRGAIDREANVRFVAGDARLEVLGPVNRFTGWFNMLGEDRGNGTVAQRNSTTLATVSGHYSRDTTFDSLSVVGYYTTEEFRNVFSRVDDDHNAETPTTRQRAPSNAVGGSAMWRHEGDAGWSSLLGGDFNRVKGFSYDDVLLAGFRRSAGGDQFQHGYFGQVDIRKGATNLFVGGRYQFTGSNKRLFSPNAGVVLGRGIMRFRASVYKAFRVPTLNELYRPFRVGNVATNPNENLKPESMYGGEVGIDLLGETRRFRFTGYRDKLTDLVTNVTLSVTPSLITRQRQNGDEAITQGLEAEAEQRWGNFTGQASYLYVDAAFASGLRVPQVARHQGSVQLSYARSGMFASLAVRAYSSQFEDDLNEFLLPGFALVQLRLMHEVGHGIALTGTIENLLNREFITGYSPNARIGNPRLWRAGIRWEI